MTLFRSRMTLYQLVRSNQCKMRPSQSAVTSGLTKGWETSCQDVQVETRMVIRWLLSSTNTEMNMTPNEWGVFYANIVLLHMKLYNLIHSRLACSMKDPNSLITMECMTNQPCVLLYTGNFLPEDDSMVGKSGAKYQRHGCFCLQTEIYHNAINTPDFPRQGILQPGQVYDHRIIFKFNC